MRGKVNQSQEKGKSIRITPAYAGKSEPRVYIATCQQDHPRLCGEKVYFDIVEIDVQGSPPPMRGKGVSGFSLTSVIRITPAYAGKSITLVDGTGWNEDHPRLCGEKASAGNAVESMSGSPPPMRGKDSPEYVGDLVARITPAYAGKSYVTVYNGNAYWDHPRLCGEKTKKIPKQRYFFHQPASFSFSLQYT